LTLQPHKDFEKT